MLRRTLLISILTCGVVTAASAGNITPYNPPIYMPSSPMVMTPLQRGQETLLQSQAFQAQMQAQQLQMQLMQQQNEQNRQAAQQGARAIGQGIDNLFSPNRPRLPLLEFLFGQHREQAVQQVVEQPMEQARTKPRGRYYRIAPQVADGPLSVYDLPVR